MKYNLVYENKKIDAYYHMIFNIMKNIHVLIYVRAQDDKCRWSNMSKGTPGIRKKNENIKAVIRSRKSKDRQHNCQKKKHKQRSTKYYIENKRLRNMNVPKQSLKIP